MATFYIKIIKRKLSPEEGGEPLWVGFGPRVPCTGERVTVMTKEGARTYKVFRVTTNFIGEQLFTVEVVKVTDAYQDG